MLRLENYFFEYEPETNLLHITEKGAKVYWPSVKPHLLDLMDQHKKDKFESIKLGISLENIGQHVLNLSRKDFFLLYNYLRNQ